MFRSNSKHKTLLAIFKSSRSSKSKAGMTLVEVMIAVAVVIVAALGTLCYEYLCIDHVRVARAELTATRIGQLLLEDWKSEGGTLDYNPEDLHMGFELPDDLPTNCVTVVDGLPLHISMTHSDVDADAFTGVKLSEISVVVSWKRYFGNGAPEGDDPRVVLTTYVRRDQ